MKRRFVSILLAVVMLFSMIPAVSAAEYDGTVGNSNVSWSFDPLTGKLTVSGYGDCHTFTSAYDQPWAHLRDKITEVWFVDMRVPLHWHMRQSIKIIVSLPAYKENQRLLH